MKKLQITADFDYVSGHLRYGHLEMELKGEDIVKWNNSTREEKEDWIGECGDFVLDDYSLNDKGDIEDITEVLIEG